MADDTQRDGDAEIVERQLSFIEGMADKWAADVNLLSMIENVVAPMRLNRSAPQKVRDQFTHRMKVQIDAICRQCFLEGALCAIDSIRQSRGDGEITAERASIVDYLRRRAAGLWGAGQNRAKHYDQIAGEIERGDHAQPEPARRERDNA